MADFSVSTGRFYGRNGSIVDKVLAIGDDGSMLETGAYANATMRGQQYGASFSAVTLPVIAATLASKAGLYNPPNSNTFVEILEVTVQTVVATTVVDAVGVYASQGSNATGATFTTPGATTLNSRVGEGPTSIATAYSAVTHVGTPFLVDIVGGYGAVTASGNGSVYKAYGLSSGRRLLFPPSSLIAIAMSTAASTASGVSVEIVWQEIPYFTL
jgi:hypothetical protein